MKAHIEGVLMSGWDQQVTFLAEEVVHLAVQNNKADATVLLASMRAAYEEGLYQTNMKHLCLSGKFEVTDAPAPYQSPGDPLPENALLSVRLAAYGDALWGKSDGGIESEERINAAVAGVFFSNWHGQRNGSDHDHSCRFEVQRFTAAELQRWMQACGIKAKRRFEKTVAKFTGSTPDTDTQLDSGDNDTQGLSQPPVPDRDWLAIAFEYGKEYETEQRALGVCPNLNHIGDHVAKRLRKEGITTKTGKPPCGAYIKRHALKGLRQPMSAKR
jgi:hypothetical protein